MGKPAARVGDMHVCPMVTPGVPPIPHVGGPILPPGKPTVLIGGMPAATMGSMCVCTGPPDSIILGSIGVLIGGQPAARMGDMCAHGGTIVVGCPTVLIGEINPPSPSSMSASAGMPGAISSDIANKMMQTAGASSMEQIVNQQALLEAAANGSELTERTDKKDFTAQFTLVDDTGKAVKDIAYEIVTNDGKKIKGKTDASGKTSVVSEYTVADCDITFFKNKK
jgi:uncharacterized Zn-binding protein involved in type VI secretion